MSLEEFSHGWEAGGVRPELIPSSKLAVHCDRTLLYGPSAFALSIR